MPKPGLPQGLCSHYSLYLDHSFPSYLKDSCSSFKHQLEGRLLGLHPTSSLSHPTFAFVITHSKCHYLMRLLTPCLLIPELLWEGPVCASRCVPSPVPHWVWPLCLAQCLVHSVCSVYLHSVHEHLSRGPRQGPGRSASGE